MLWKGCTRFCWLAVAIAGVPAAAHAQVYRCAAPGGSVAFQDQPCASGQVQTVMDVPSRAPPGYVPAPVATSPLPPPVSSALPAPLPPAAPLPVLYACVGAVDGRHYLARNPPPPYLAPLGVMGYPPQSLAQTYGAPGGAGMSAPELSRPRVGGPPIAAGMTPVQDACAPATHAEVCSFVQREFDENHRKLRMAMRHEQPPYAQREQQLQDELRNCQ